VGVGEAGGEGRRVRHLLLDADGVLQSHPTGFELAAGRYVEDPADFFEQVTIREREYIRGDAGFLDALGAVLAGRGVRVPAAEVHEAVWRQFRVDPAMADLVRGLQRAGVAVHLATNQEPGRAAAIKASEHVAGLDGGYYSCDLGAAKPDAAYFEAVLADLGVEAGDVVFVDDNEENVAGARACGLRAEQWVNTDDLALLRDLLAKHGLRPAAG
jgi:putative hydrolase of the HAD superfamily